MELKGILVGVGGLEWDNRQTGERGERMKISLAEGKTSALPKLFDIEEAAMRDALALPFGAAVVLKGNFNRYNQFVINAVTAA